MTSPEVAPGHLPARGTSITVFYSVCLGLRKGPARFEDCNQHEALPDSGAEA